MLTNEEKTVFWTFLRNQSEFFVFFVDQKDSNNRGASNNPSIFNFGPQLAEIDPKNHPKRVKIGVKKRVIFDGFLSRSLRVVVQT